MKLQNMIIIFIIIILPVILTLSVYVGYEIRTVKLQNQYNAGIISATHDAIFSFEMNTKNDDYNSNAENKRSNIKAAVKTFESSLSTACNLNLYNNNNIDEYIPAIVFGLYDGFYMYAPSYVQNQGYKHNLKNYVYYSETISGTDIVINYTLDNYVAVSGTFSGKYTTRAGYLINASAWEGNIRSSEVTSEYYYDETTKTKKLRTTNPDKSAAIYLTEAKAFTTWFNANVGNKSSNLLINATNDPDRENSSFTQHKRTIIKSKIEETLNGSITAYGKRLGNNYNYKMPKFNAEDWEKVYSNISVISFVQGMPMGFKNFNNYCILNSTNNQEYVNPNLMYFSDGIDYHDIRCENIKNRNTTGYKIGSFEKAVYEYDTGTTNASGDPVYQNRYYYKHKETACYGCINGNSTRKSSSGYNNLYEYILAKGTTQMKQSYLTALARERQNTVKLLHNYEEAYNK